MQFKPTVEVQLSHGRALLQKLGYDMRFFVTNSILYRANKCALLARSYYRYRL